jgi:hypothetical protein
MDAPLSRRLRTLIALPLLVVAVVAGGSTGLAGLQLNPAAQALPTAPDRPFQAVLGQVASQAEAAWDAALGTANDTPASPTDAPGFVGVIGLQERTAARLEAAQAASKPVEVEKPKAVAKPKLTVVSPPAPVVAAAARTFAGKNHFWMPALGIDKKVHDYPCPRKRPPDHYVYRWWCAGDNNVYLLGHASSVMKPLHDAYVRGRLRVGMAAYYADANGVVTKYKITEWRVVRPEESHWAIAHQPVPSMTLQTCVGKNDEFRLNVRLVAVAYL